MRRDSQFCQCSMVRFHGVDRFDVAVGQCPELFDERKLMLGGVDLAAEQGDAGAVFLRFPEHLERVERRAGRTAENADDDATNRN